MLSNLDPTLKHQIQFYNYHIDVFWNYNPFVWFLYIIVLGVRILLMKVLQQVIIKKCVYS